MLICEELFLLLTKDSGKPESRMTYPAYGLTGALLTDLLLAGRISLSNQNSGGACVKIALPEMAETYAKQ